MIVFYKDIIKKIMSGVQTKYPAKSINKLGEWLQHDKDKNIL